MKTRLVLLLSLLLLSSCQPIPRTATLALLGDLMLGRGLTPDPSSLAYLAPQIRSADLALANLESPLTSNLPASPSGYNLCTSAAHAALLADWGLDLLSLANNHQYDCSTHGPELTRQALLSSGLTSIGPDSAPVYRTVHGLHLAFFAFDDVTAPLDGDLAARAISMAHSSGSLVIVYVHWGLEYQSGPIPRQIALAQQFAASGACLIVGSHPHVLQPAAWIPTESGKALVLYSLGNALFDQPGLPDTRQSALLLVTLDSHDVQSVQVIPFMIDISASRLVAPDPSTIAHVRSTLGLP